MYDINNDSHIRIIRGMGWDFMSIPNIITVIRIMLIPVFIWVYLDMGTTYGIILLLIIGFTDLLDGFIARKFNMITKIGQVLDPLADKLVQLSVCVCLYLRDIMPLWFVIALSLKELILIIGSGFLYKKYDKSTPAKWYGKLATVSFYTIVVIAFIFGDYLYKHSVLKNTLFGVALFLAIFSLVNYYNIYFKNRKEYNVSDENNNKMIV